jgi:hypothetical protein
VTRAAKSTARPRLDLVPKPEPVMPAARKSPPKRSASGAAGATPGKQRLLHDLLSTRAAFLGSIQGLSAAEANRPTGEGKWSVREIVLHLCARDRARLREMDRTLRGTPRSWAGRKEQDWARANEEDLAPLRHLNWEQALGLLHATRHELLEALDMIPDEPAEVWDPAHAFGDMMAGLPPHDLHHAEAIRRWRGGRNS